MIAEVLNRGFVLDAMKLALADLEAPDERRRQLPSGGPRLRDALGEVLATRGVTAWLWGHEHRCVVFDPNEGVGLASCVDHGGVPVYASRDEAAWAPALRDTSTTDRLRTGSSAGR